MEKQMFNVFIASIGFEEDARIAKSMRRK